MIFDTIKYGIFTTDDFVYAHTNNDFSKFISLPIDVRKQFVSDAVDKTNKEYPNKENNNLKQAAFDFIDKKIDEKQFRDIWRKYWLAGVMLVPRWKKVSWPAVVTAVAAVTVTEVAAVDYRACLEHHASLLNKLIQEYE